MEQYRTRMIVGTALMGLGLAAELIMLSGRMLDERPPAWIWGMILWIGVGGAVLISAFVAAGRDRRERTRALLEQGGPPAPLG